MQEQEGTHPKTKNCILNAVRSRGLLSRKEAAASLWDAGESQKLLIKKANSSGGSEIQQQMQQEATSRCGTNENVVNLCSKRCHCSTAATAAGCLLTSQGAKCYHKGPKKQQPHWPADAAA